ncbi:MAG TPA: hypothetical protein VHS31_01915 [Tepidisphaeraceae bacterium]|nr:hypothetical protein [Tepidisphaeraceae bacterium]
MPKPKKRGRKWMKIAIGIVVAILLLILLLPTIAGFGFVRSIVVGKINQGMDGKVEIDDWSLGWFSGTTVRGVRVFDVGGTKILGLDKLTTELSFLDAIRGKIDLGKTNIDGIECNLNFKESEKGKSGSKKESAKPQVEGKPIEIPNVNGNITLTGKVQIDGEDINGSGDASGTISIKSSGQTSNTIDGQLVIANAQLSGTAMKGDTLKTTITVPLSIVREGADAKTSKITIKSLGVRMPDLVDASITGQVPQQALENIADHKAPGETGTLDLTLNVPNLQAVATQLASAMSLLPDVKITGGELTHTTHIDVREKDLAVSNRLSFSAQGTRAGQPIKMEKVEISKADATFDPAKQSLAGLADLSVNIQSPFFTMQGGGVSLGKLNLPGTFNLDELHKQLAQFVDFKNGKLSGTGTFNITSVGDVATQPVNTQIVVGIQNLAVTLPGDHTLEFARLDTTTNAKVNLSANTIDHFDTFFQTGDGKNTIIDLNCSAEGIDLSSGGVKHFDLTRLNVMDLATAQQQLDPFVPALKEMGLRITEGQLYTNVSGSVDGKTRTIQFDSKNPLAFSTPNLTVQKVAEDGTASAVLTKEKITASALGSVSMPADGSMAVSLKTLAIDTSDKLFSVRKADGSDLNLNVDDNGVSGGGTLLLAADVKGVSDLLHRFGGTAATKTSAGQVSGGQLDAQMVLAQGAKTTAQFTGAIKSLSVTTADPSKPIANETVSFALNAQSDSGVESATGTISSGFGNVNLKQASYAMKGGKWAAVAEADAPDLAKVDALLAAFQPPPAPVVKKGKKVTPPADAGSPMQITSGSAKLTLNASGVGKVADGDGLIEVASVSTNGMDIKNLLIPVILKGGVLRTVYKDKPEGQNKAPPASCNGGSIDLGNITCDLNGDNPRISMAKNQRIILGVSINPLLGDSLGKYINPVFANSKQAAGKLDITVASCQNLALGEKLKSDESGTARIGFSLSDMNIANPLGSLMFGKLTGDLSKIPGIGDFGGLPDQADVFTGQIRDGIVTIDKGKAQTDITLLLNDSDTPAPTKGKQAQKGMPLNFKGDVDLIDQSQNLTATIPVGLIGKYVRDKNIQRILASSFPDGIPVTLTGTTTNPKVVPIDLQKVIGSQLANPANIGNLLDSIRKKGK